jgi:hypothetical protein
MADPHQLRIELVYRDDSGRRGSGISHLPYGTTFDVAKGFALALARAAEKISDAQLVAVFIKQSIEMDITVPAALGSDVTRCGVFIAESVVTDDRYLIQIPSLLSSKLETGGTWAGININQADADVAALLSLILTGDGTVAPVSAALNDLATTDAAYLEWRTP